MNPRWSLSDNEALQLGAVLLILAQSTSLLTWLRGDWKYASYCLALPPTILMLMVTIAPALSSSSTWLWLAVYGLTILPAAVGARGRMPTGAFYTLWIVHALVTVCAVFLAFFFKIRLF